MIISFVLICAVIFFISKWEKNYKDFVVDKNYINKHKLINIENTGSTRIIRSLSDRGDNLIYVNDICSFIYNCTGKDFCKKGDILYTNESIYLVLEITDDGRTGYGDFYPMGKCIRLKPSINKFLVNKIQKL